MVSIVLEKIGTRKNAARSRAPWVEMVNCDFLGGSRDAIALVRATTPRAIADVGRQDGRTRCRARRGLAPLADPSVPLLQRSLLPRRRPWSLTVSCGAMAKTSQGVSPFARHAARKNFAQVEKISAA
jgi:hypothetical protein